MQTPIETAELQAEQPELVEEQPDDAEVEALRAETEFFVEIALRYIDLIGLKEFLRDVDFARLITDELDKMRADTHLNLDNLRGRDRFKLLLEKLTIRCSIEASRCFGLSHFTKALQYTVIALECSRITGCEVRHRLLTCLSVSLQNAPPDVRPRILQLIPREPIVKQATDTRPPHQIEDDGLDETADFRQAIEMAKSDPVAAFARYTNRQIATYARRCHAKGDSRSELLLQKEITRRKPGNVSASIHLALVLEATGDFEQALIAHQKVHELLQSAGQDTSKCDKRIAGLEAMLAQRAAATAVARAARVTARREALAPPATMPESESASGSARRAKDNDDAATETCRDEEPNQSNIDYSRFDRFIESLAREAPSWPLGPGGEPCRTVPEADRERLEGAMQRFDDTLRRKIDKRARGPFWGSFDNVRKQIVRGNLNLMALQTLQDRMPDGIDWDMR